MKKVFYKVLLATAMLLLGMGQMNAQDVSFEITTNTIGDYFKTYSVGSATVTVASPQGMSSSSGDYFVTESTTPSNAGANYIEVKVTGGVLANVEYLITGNGSGKVMRPAVLGWEGTVSTTSADFVADQLSQIVSNKGKANALWFTYDLTSKDLTTVRFYRAVKGVAVGAYDTKTTIGGQETVQFYGLRVTLKANGPSVKLSKTSVGDSTQTIMQTETLEAITFNLAGGATNAATTINWSPSQPSWIAVDNTTTEGTITISGSATTSDAAGAFTYTITPNNGTADGTPVTGTITLTAYVTPAPTITLTSATGTDAQKKKAGVAITPIEYTIANVQSAAVEGLDASEWAWDSSAGKITITLTPATQATYPTDIDYTITTVALDGYTGDLVTKTGKITVKDPDKKTVAFLYESNANSGASAAAMTIAAGKMIAALGDYDVAGYDLYQKTATDMQNIITENYDLIILHESVPSGNAAAVELGKSIGQVPILNTKVHMHTKLNWPGGGAGKNAEKTLDVNPSASTEYANNAIYLVSGQENHQIFTGLSSEENGSIRLVTSAGGVRHLSDAATNGTTLATSAINTGGVTITEIDGTKKYLLIGIIYSSLDALNTNGLALVKNACDYLMGIAPAAGTEAEITAFFIGETEGTINVDKTINVVMPVGTDISSLDVNLTKSRGATLLAPASLTGIDFTAPVTFSVQSEDLATTNDYVVTVSVASNPAPAITGGTNKTQEVGAGEAIVEIAFDIANAASVSVDKQAELEAIGLTVNITTTSVTISGTVNAAATLGNYEFTVEATALDAGVPPATAIGKITVKRAVCTSGYAGTYPYTTDIPAAFAIPCWMDSPTLLFNGAYDGSDVINLGSGADVLRIGANEKFDMYLADITNLGVITVNVSATGGRQYKLYINDVEKAHFQKTGGGNFNSDTKVVVTFDASELTGAAKISIENIGGGGATIGNINLAAKLKSTDATLSSLSVSTGTLSPAFSATENNYEVQLPYGTTSLPTISAATCTHTNASRVINDATLGISRVASVVVTAEDETIQNTYYVTFIIADDPFITGTPTFVDEVEGDITENSVNIAWNAYTDAATYTLTVKDAPNGSIVGTPYTGLTATSQLIEGLNPNTDYVFELVAYKADGTTASQTATTTRTTEVTTNIKDASVTAVKVFAQASNIVVETEAGATINVVNAAGKQIFAGKSVNNTTVIPATQGLYIVLVNGSVTKVIVK